MNWKGLTIVLLFQRAALAELAIREPTLKPHSILEDFLLKAWHGRQFRMLQVFQWHFEDCPLQSVLREEEVPRLLWTDWTGEVPQLRQHFNSELLSIVCMRGAAEESGVSLLAASLQHMRGTPIIFVWQQLQSELAHGQHCPVDRLVAYCKQHDMLNFIILFGDFHIHGQYYSLKPFPELTLVERNSSSLQGELFGQSLAQNLNGHALLTAADWSEPRAIFYTDLQGHGQMSGYMVKLIKAFARTINATVVLPLGSQKIYLRDLLDFTRNKTIDLATSLSNPKIEMNVHEYTYPIEIGKWFTMLPVEAEIPVDRMFFRILVDWRVYCVLIVWVPIFSALSRITKYALSKQSSVFWSVDFVVSDVALRGLLAQSFIMPTNLSLKQMLVYYLIIFAGFMTSTMYASFVNSYLVRLPRQPRIVSFDDLLTSELKVLISAKELPTLVFNKGEAFWSKYGRCYAVSDSFDIFVETRKSFNTSYGYTVTTALWPIFERQQRHFARRMFRASLSLVYDKFALSAIPIQENSIHKNNLDNFILNTHAYGLLQHWFQSSYFDMVAARKISMADKSIQRTFHVFRVEDFYWVWVTYIALHMLAMLAFVLECHLITL